MVLINIEVIPHDKQRYETVGDWWVNDSSVLEIRVSQMKNSLHEALIGLHELVEAITETVLQEHRLTIPSAMLIKSVDSFDKTYIKNGEPGYVPEAPYYFGHMAASAIEHIAAMIWGVNYNDYEDEINGF